jgi:cytochrome P450
MAVDPIKFFSQLTQRYGDVVPLRMGVSKILFVNQPALINQLIRDRNCWRSDESRKAIRSFLGDGLLALEGNTHLRHRRLVSPAFHRNRFCEYGALMCSETAAELAQWRPSETRDIREDMYRLTFSIVSKALFSADTSGEADEVGRAIKEVLPWMLVNASLAGLATWMPTWYPPSARASLKRLKQLVHNIVARRLAEGGDRGDLLSMLLAARDEGGGALSEDDICDESLTLLMAGHDTTASTMAWACYLLAQNPAIQTAVAAEVRAVAGDAPITIDMLGRLPLTQQVIDETLRLFPVVWIGDRTPQKDIKLGEYDVPAGTRVMFSMYVTQRDGRFFPDPERFDPARFSPQRVNEIPDGAYLPFGAGVHMCPGNNFALMEARVILAATLQRFELSLVPEHRVRLDPQVVLSPLGELPLLLRARTHTERGMETARAM